MTNGDIIKIIKERKDILKVNQEYLAELSEVGIATLKRFESGKGNITLKNLQKIADILGLEIKLEIRKPKKEASVAAINFEFSNPDAYTYLKS